MVGLSVSLGWYKSYYLGQEILVPLKLQRIGDTVFMEGLIFCIYRLDSRHLAAASF